MRSCSLSFHILPVATPSGWQWAPFQPSSCPDSGLCVDWTLKRRITACSVFSGISGRSSLTVLVLSLPSLRNLLFGPVCCASCRPMPLSSYDSQHCGPRYYHLRNPYNDDNQRTANRNSLPVQAEACQQPSYLRSLLCTGGNLEQPLRTLIHPFTLPPTSQKANYMRLTSRPCNALIP